MRFASLVPAKFVRRVNRFLCMVQLGNKETLAYIRNTGRLKELLIEGSPVYLKEKDTGKYKYEVLLTETNRGFLVCLDSQIAPRLYAETLTQQHVIYEPRINGSRLDLLVGRYIIEVKSVNLVKDHTALFPDAPTKRGTKHIHILINAYPKFVPKMVFVVQREDAKVFSPNAETDPVFAQMLKRFAHLGYEVKAYNCFVSLEEIKLKEEIEVIL
ncbi:DNA/RNA nuclease SfsA [Hydrogenobacter hydrogenophilus]|uniref:Sugar fermentation stimulation protein homolog n=1 Tax=Hydrogenobacter hydrogenophilus TaxID=35835 RepID=A0A285NY91_9AQUI|nr:DNA/RNA nuclease SfsA [Hydrogenobacter hydrogenophilus]SNZ14409.1 sugar fermentation stimulation protein A [Hydrogenobacter hydrogenophilus]